MSLFRISTLGHYIVCRYSFPHFIAWPLLAAGRGSLLKKCPCGLCSLLAFCSREGWWVGVVGFGPGPRKLRWGGGRVSAARPGRGDSRFRRGSPGNTPAAAVRSTRPSHPRSWWGPVGRIPGAICHCGGHSSQRNVAKAPSLGTSSLPSPQESRPRSSSASQPGPLCWLSCLRGSPHLPWGYHWSADIHSLPCVCLFHRKEFEGDGPRLRHCLRVFP